MQKTVDLTSFLAFRKRSYLFFTNETIFFTNETVFFYKRDYRFPTAPHPRTLEKKC